MNDLYNVSILDEIEETLDYGDKAADPFKILDVKSIKVDNDFINVFDIIDLENLFNETTDFEEEKWEDLISQLVISEEDKAYLTRFSWWICREILFGPEGTHLINIVDILKNQEKNFYVKIFIYTMNDFHRIGINLPTGAGIVIKFKNNSPLI